jgi:hypothetical protein
MATMSKLGHAVGRHQDTGAGGALRRFLTAVDTFMSGAADGQAANRAYRELVRLGATHEQAVEIVLDQHLRAR